MVLVAQSSSIKIFKDGERDTVKWELHVDGKFHRAIGVSDITNDDELKTSEFECVQGLLLDTLKDKTDLNQEILELLSTPK